MAGIIPVILCGKTTQIAVGVIANLKPEFDVIHLCLTPDAGKVEIPAILKEQPVTSETELGSKNYTQVPKAIILGGGYEDDMIEVMRKACIEAKAPSVPWLRPDLTKPAPPLGPAYGKALVERIKVRFAELEKEGVKGDAHDVYYY